MLAVSHGGGLTATAASSTPRPEGLAPDKGLTDAGLVTEPNNVAKRPQHGVDSDCFDTRSGAARCL